MGLVESAELERRRRARAGRRPPQALSRQAMLGAERAARFRQRIHLQTSVVQVLASLHLAYVETEEHDPEEVLDRFCRDLTGEDFATTMVGLEMLAGPLARR